MIVYFATVKRKRPVRDAGELVELDWSAKKVLRAIPVFPYDPDIEDDPNPRGNSRGGKGIVVSGNELFVGTYHSILVFDLDLHMKRKIDNPLFVNIHEMCLAVDGLWVSATAIDCALRVDRQGRTLESWWPREEKLLQERYGLLPLAIDKHADNRLLHVHAGLSGKPHHTHLNGIVSANGKSYALLNKLGVVVQIEPSLKVVLEDPLIRGGHSPVISPDGDRLILCSSFNKAILAYDLESGKMAQRIDLLSFSEIANLQRLFPDQPFNQSIFVRGLEILDSGRVLAGISPAAILEIDMKRNRLLDWFRYSDEVGDAVHGLTQRPGDEAIRSRQHEENK